MGVKEVFIYLENLGLLNVVIPFIIIFIVLYALLNRVKLFKDNRVNVTLATLVSFIAIAAADVVTNVNLFSYYLVVLIFVIIAVLMLIALLGGKLDLMSGKKKTYFSWFVAVGLCLAVIYALYLSGIKIDLGPVSYNWLRSIIPITIAVLVFILIVWFITSPGKVSEAERAKAKAETKKSEKAAADKEPSESEKKFRPKWVFEKKIKEKPEKGRIELGS
ncbi:hypothetical protein JW851_03525 [Candidatus Woesearchaeota archaeon]|nr:hypothetical protein [Candidatus Woesearchaeota archaeon]